MRTEILPFLFSFVWPAAILLLVFYCVPYRREMAVRQRRWFPIMAALAVGIMVIPVGGLPLGRWFTGVCANFSMPLLALIASVIARRVFNADLLDKNGMRTALWFGAVAGCILFPMALGLGSIDPYSLGWNFSALFVITGALTTLLLWLGNRFGLVLLSAIVAYHLGLLESDNYWDYLVDPVYFLISLATVARASLRRIRRAPAGACDHAA